MSSPKMVVGLPVYNGEAYIAEAIEAHLSQSFQDFELLVSDNASTDATVEICENYSAKDSRIRILRSPMNGGNLWNHRRVLDAVDDQTPYFRWAGADDIPEPGLLEAMANVLDRRPDVSAVMPATKNIDEKGSLIGSMGRTLNLESEDVFERAKGILLANFQHVVAYGLLRTMTIRKMRTRPRYVGWDPVFIWELALRGKIHQLEQPALLRRFHPGSISRVKSATEMRKWAEPTTRAGMRFPNWTWEYERFRAFCASPMAIRDKTRVGILVMRSILWHREYMARDVTQAVRRLLGFSDEYTF